MQCPEGDGSGTPRPSPCSRYSQDPQGSQLAEGVGSDLPDAVVLEVARAARQAG